jgi:hypothetical protein
MRIRRSMILLGIVAACLGGAAAAYVRLSISRRLTIERRNRMMIATLLITGQWPELRSEKDAPRSGSGTLNSSWRFPTLLQLRNYRARPHFDIPWDAVENKWFVDFCPMEYCEAGNPHTCVMAIVGSDTPFGNGGINYLGELPSDTILILECRKALVHWMEPGDFALDDLLKMTPATAGLGGNSGDQQSFCVGFADSSVWLMSYDTPMETLLHFATIEGARAHDRDRELRPFRLAYRPRPEADR